MHVGRVGEEWPTRGRRLDRPWLNVRKETFAWLVSIYLLVRRRRQIGIYRLING